MQSLMVLILLFLPRLPASVEQRQGGAHLRLEADKVDGGAAEARLSSELRLTLTVEGLAPLEIDEAAVLRSQLDELKAAGPWLRLEAVGKAEREPLADGRERWRLALRLDPAKDGKRTLTAAPLEYAEGPDQRPHKAEWQPIPLTIVTTVASPDVRKELRDITGPEEIPVAPSWVRHLPWVGLGVVALGVLGALVVRLRRPRPAPPLEPHERALQDLECLESQGLPAAGEIERYHTRLADVVRSYLEERFRLPATHQTTAEFLVAMRRSPQLTAAQQGLLRDFLERCDMAKFARAAPTADECRAAADMARAFVRQTIPTPAKPETSPRAGA